MKNLLSAIILLVVVFSFSETKAQISVGGGLHYGTDINNVGFSANGKYEFNESWAAAPSFTYFLKKNNVNWSALDLDANYQITEIGEIGGLYGIGGLNLTFWGYKIDDSLLGEYAAFYGDLDTNATEVGLNLGLGLNVVATEKLAIAPEIRYTVGGANYFRIGVKVMFAL